MFFGQAAIISATFAAVGAYHQAQADVRQRAAEAEEDLWFAENILPLLSREDQLRVLAERKRDRERREDIDRQERHHRERIAAENRKARAMEARANNFLNPMRVYIHPWVETEKNEEEV